MFKNEKTEKITITRDEFVGTFMEVLTNPFRGVDMPEEDKARMQMAMMMTGMLLLKKMDEKLFGEEE